MKIIKKELILHSNFLNHPFLIELLFSFVDEKRSFFIFEYISGIL